MTSMTLVAGATGVLGGEICRLLRNQGKAVRALTRATSNPDRVAELRRIGVELVQGDLTDRASLDTACRGVDAVISTATVIGSQQPGDTIEKVDQQGQVNLVDAAEAQGVRQFVLISFPEIPLEFPLQSAKRAVEQRLRQSRMTWTILQPTFFAEVWLGSHLGFDLANGNVRIYGDGQRRTSWISFRDVAKFAVAALDNPHAANKVIELGGPEALSPLEVVRRAEQISGRPVTVEHVPEAALRAQHAAATDSRQRTFAGLMVYYALGDEIGMTETLRDLPIGRLRSVDEYLRGA